VVAGGDRGRCGRTADAFGLYRWSPTNRTGRWLGQRAADGVFQAAERGATATRSECCGKTRGDISGRFTFYGANTGVQVIARDDRIVWGAGAETNVSADWGSRPRSWTRVKPGTGRWPTDTTQRVKTGGAADINPGLFPGKHRKVRLSSRPCVKPAPSTTLDGDVSRDARCKPGMRGHDRASRFAA